VLALSGCSDVTQLVVVIRSDVGPPTMDRIGILAVSPSGTEISLDDRVDIGSFPLSQGVIHGAGELGPVTIDYFAGRDGSTVLPEFVHQESREVSFVLGETRLVQFDLLEPCAGVSCFFDDTIDTVCRRGSCVEPGGAAPPEFDGSIEPLDLCDGVDDDDDGRDGEDVNFAIDRDHCGGCDQPCNGPCVEGVCRMGPITTLEAGMHVTCALRSDVNVISCWGANAEGELGIEEPFVLYSGHSRPMLHQEPARQFSVGFVHACLVNFDGGVSCWGLNHVQQLGQTDGTFYYSPVSVAGLSGVQSVEVGLFHTCVITTAGGVKCWGGNDAGQIGLPSGAASSTATPTDVPVTGSIVELAAGGYHTCARRMNNEVVCWGEGPWLDPDSGAGEFMPILTNAQSIDAGAEHTCVVLTSGEVRCWGYNASGVFGGLTPDYAEMPVAVPGLPAMASVQAGVMQVTGMFITFEGTMCGLSRATPSQVWCWGRSDRGQTGVISPSAVGPRHVEGLDGATSIAVGGQHLCALVAGEVRCIGSNEWGQLGQWSYGGDDIVVPVLVREP
jgi:alpha-tubulin suppressor-like RCC1 family protein